jgi:hypothetical protein
MSAHDYEMFNNFDELPFCVSQKGERGDMHKKPEKRNVVDDTNPEGGYSMRRLRTCRRSLRRGTISTSTSTSTLMPSTLLLACMLGRALRKTLSG